LFNKDLKCEIARRLRLVQLAFSDPANGKSSTRATFSQGPTRRHGLPNVPVT
jgi:hypothetical protein